MAANSHLFCAHGGWGNGNSVIEESGNASTDRTSRATGNDSSPSTSEICSSRTSESRDGAGQRGAGGDGVVVRKLDWFRNPFSENDDSNRGAGSRLAAPSRTRENKQGGNSDDDDHYHDDDDDNNSRREGSGACSSTNFEYRYAWECGELMSLLRSAQHRATELEGRGGLVILASDVIYDEDLTEAFFDVLKTLMPAPPPPPRESNRSTAGNALSSNPSPPISSVPPVLYMALEKRFNFTIAELSVAATGYKALLRNVLDLTAAAADSSDSSSSGVRAAKDDCRSSASEDAAHQQQEADHQQAFEGVRLPLTFLQCFQYQRNTAMELWEIRRRSLQL